MSVEKAIRPFTVSPFSAEVEKPSFKNALEKLKEVTGCNDETLLREALLKNKVTNTKGSSDEEYDVDAAVLYLFDDKRQRSAANNSRRTDVNMQTVDGEDDLQKAIQQSLKDCAGLEKLNGGNAGTTGISQEEQELSKVIEASLHESQQCPPSYSSLLFVDPANPYDRRRNGHWPVGLKNVGNTCWFNVVIQVLFHIPEICKKVLNFVHTSSNVVATKQVEHKGGFSAYPPPLPKELDLLNELRVLFAYLIGSKRMYVDPSNVINVIKNDTNGLLKFNSTPSSGGLPNQQDVSEFIHILLQWLEFAFCSQGNAATGDDSSLNPIVNLFYGKTEVFDSEGLSRCDNFSQHVVQVSGFSNLHDSLEACACLCAPEHENNKASAEQWFTCLPPVLFFELSRYKYNQTDKRPEKIHEVFEFPNELYMDRYLKENSVVVRKKRCEVDNLKKKLKLHKQYLERYLKYGSESEKLPLSTVLKYAKEFVNGSACSSSVPVASSTCDVNGNDQNAVKPDSTSLPRPASPMDTSNAGSSQGESSAQMEVEQTSALHSHVGTTTGVSECAPPSSLCAPRDISDEDRCLFLRCLSRWREEILKEEAALRQKIHELERLINEAYEQPELQKHGYTLHSVLVHEGEANAGHYWTFVKEPTSQTWLKFNDVQVSQSSWEDVQKDCFGGGKSNASAYCLIYVNSKADDLLSDCFSDNDPLRKLPVDLANIVLADNKKFEDELLNWQSSVAGNKDLRQLSSSSNSGSSNTATSSLPSSQTQTNPSFRVIQELPSSASPDRSVVENNLNVAAQDVVNLIQNVAQKIGAVNTAEQHSLEDLLEHIIKEAIDCAKCCARDYLLCPKNDARTRSLLCYVLVQQSEETQLPERLVQYVCLEQLTIPALEQSDLCKRVKQMALEKLHTIKLDENEQKLYESLHSDFEIFRKTVLLVSLGIESYYKSDYLQALKVFICAVQTSKDIVKTVPKCLHSRRSLDPVLLKAYKCLACLKVAQKAVETFLSASDDKSAETIVLDMSNIFLPCLSSLKNELTLNDFNVLVHEVQQPWIDLLSSDCQALSEKKSACLQPFLEQFLEIQTGPEMSLPKLSAKYRLLNDIGQRYWRALLSAAQDTDAKHYCNWLA